jgi:hypothetical protein
MYLTRYQKEHIAGKFRFAEDWRVVREVEGAALEMRFASNRRNVGSNPMLSAHFINKNSTAVFDLPGAVFICQ